jgi:hypothetical protein
MHTDFIESLGRAIKYLTERQDFYPALAGPELTPHLMYADYLRDNGEPELGDRIHKEVELTQQGVRPKPAKLGDSHSLHDFVLHAVRTGHPNPTVRALSGRFNEPPHPDLANVLFHSDNPSDHDVAVWLSPEDKAASHSSHDLLKRINSKANFDHNLEAKVVRGTVYLLDHAHPDRNAYGAPGIVFTAPVNDRSEVEALGAHADQLRAERAGLGGVARMGPAH